MFAKYKSVIYESLMVILGCAIFGAGLDAFVLPHKLVSTGISGVGLILYYVTGLSVGSWNMILNIPIFWAALEVAGHPCCYQTLYGTLMLSWMVDLFNFLQYDMIIKDPLLSSMMAGITTGVGLGIVYRVAVTQVGLILLHSLYANIMDFKWGPLIVHKLCYSCCRNWCCWP